MNSFLSHSKKDEVINAFFEEIQESSFTLKKVKVSKVLGQNDISKGCFYHYFKNLEDLVEQALCLTVSRIDNKVIQVLNSKEPRDLSTAFKEIISFLFQVEVKAKLVAIAIQYFQHNPKGENKKIRSLVYKIEKTVVSFMNYYDYSVSLGTSQDRNKIASIVVEESLLILFKNNQIEADQFIENLLEKYRL